MKKKELTELENRMKVFQPEWYKQIKPLFDTYKAAVKYHQYVSKMVEQKNGEDVVDVVCHSVLTSILHGEGPKVAR